MQLIWPWVSRAAFDLLREQLVELRAERKLLLDRLATMGLGGPLFEKPEQPVKVEEREEEPLAASPEQVNYEELMRVVNNPRALKNAVRRQVLAAARQRNDPPSVGWIPQQITRVTEMMDTAEAEGRKQP